MLRLDTQITTNVSISAKTSANTNASTKANTDTTWTSWAQSLVVSLMLLTISEPPDVVPFWAPKKCLDRKGAG